MEPQRWGEAGLPLLPESLRRAFASETLPAWLLADLGLPEDATTMALDQSVWGHLERIPERVERFFLTLLAYRSAEIGDLRVVESSAAVDIDPRQIVWPTRLRNALKKSGMLGDGAQIEAVTYGELLALPALGVKSALEFGALMEVVVNSGVPALDESAREDLMTAAEEDWSERIQSVDPRFRDVVPALGGSIAELIEEAINNPEGPRAAALLDALPGIRTRAREIASEPIDIALRRLLKAHGISERDATMVFERLGWNGGESRTLQEIADDFSLSRERVRQVVKSVVDQIGHAYVPQLEKAIEVVADSAPLLSADAAQLLVDRGLSTAPMSPEALEATAEMLGYEAAFTIDRTTGTAYVVARGAVASGTILATARRQSGRVGVSNVDEVTAELHAVGEAVSAEDVSRLLHSSPRARFLVEDWFWMPGIPADRNRLRNVTRRMLSVAPRLGLATIRQGVRRRYRFMRVDLVPPVAVLRAFFEAHSEFEVHGDVVQSVPQLDYRKELGQVERTFVEILQEASTGLLDRTQLEEAATAHGVNPNTFSVFTTYSPILDHPALNAWCLRGHSTDPVKLEALLAAAATRERRRRTLSYGWDDYGRLTVTSEVSSVSGPVIGIPSGIARYVAGRRFRAKTLEGTSAGTVAINEQGSSWGYGPFLRRRGAEVGDALTASFDLVNQEVVLSLGDDEALEDEED